MQNYFDYFKKAWLIYRSNIKTFFSFSAFIAVLSLVSGLVSNSVPINSRFSFLPLLLPVAIFLASLVFIIALYQSVNRAISNQPALDFKDRLSKSLKRFWPFLTTAILVGIIVVAGTILLIVPGILFAIWYFASLYISANEDVSTMASLDRSKRLVSGRWWQVFGYIIILGLMVGIPLAILSIPVTYGLTIPFGQLNAGVIVSALISLIFTPFEYLIVGMIYYDLKNTAGE